MTKSEAIPEPAATATGEIVVHHDGHRVRYWRHGTADESLLVLHGGPGHDHRYLNGFAQLASDQLQVVLFDQLGSGKSDYPHDPELWHIERFVDEVEAVRTHLGLGRIHLIGHSWGGFLSLQYALTHPQALATVILANTSSSMTEILQGWEKIRGAWPEDVYHAARRLEVAGQWNSPEYQELILRTFMAVHMRRSTPYDPDVSVQELLPLMPLFEAPGPVRGPMIGDRPMDVTGNMIDWDVSDQLSEVSVPTLILSGFYDGIPTSCSRRIADGIPNSELVVFGQSSHMVMLEREAAPFFGVIADFVRRNRNSAP